ncbi:MAG: cell division protein FtsH, partial [Mesorhizobium sp.]
MDRKHTFNIGYVIVAFLIIELFQVWFAYRDTAHISYSDVIRLTEEGKVASVTLTETMIEGAFKEPLDGKT